MSSISSRLLRAYVVVSMARGFNPETDGKVLVDLNARVKDCSGIGFQFQVIANKVDAMSKIDTAAWRKMQRYILKYGPTCLPPTLPTGARRAPWIGITQLRQSIADACEIHI